MEPSIEHQLFGQTSCNENLKLVMAFSLYIILDLFRAFLPKEKGYSTSTDKLHLENAIEKLQRQISVNEEQSGLIVVSVLMEDPFLSANITNYIADYVKEFISLEQEKEAIKKKEFIFRQMQSAKIDLSDSEFKLTNFVNIVSLSSLPELTSIYEINGKPEPNASLSVLMPFFNSKSFSGEYSNKSPIVLIRALFKQL